MKFGRPCYQHLYYKKDIGSHPGRGSLVGDYVGRMKKPEMATTLSNIEGCFLFSYSLKRM